MIALLTDFGLEDHYVGSLKAVIASVNPNAKVFDISHDVRPQNIREGAFILNAVYPFLPKGAIVVAVVDPGVGSRRQAIAVKTARGYLIGPNNGIFTLALEREKKYEVRTLINDRYFMKPVSSTFHGRDMFSPSAAHLSKKNIFRSFGPKISHLHRLHWPQAKVTAKSVQGEITYIDRFGNAFTNISKSHVDGTVQVEVKRKKAPLKPFFSAGAQGSLIAVWNSSALLEFAVRDDSAEKIYGLKVGDPVLVRLR
jgi:S-adenosyl-L-methionine hydrolase (adenosine-forming)